MVSAGQIVENMTEIWAMIGKMRMNMNIDVEIRGPQRNTCVLTGVCQIRESEIQPHTVSGFALYPRDIHK